MKKYHIVREAKRMPIQEDANKGDLYITQCTGSTTYEACDAGEFTESEIIVALQEKTMKHGFILRAV